MERLTTDTPKNNLQTALNLFYAKDGEAWVRGGGPEYEYQDVPLFTYIRSVIQHQALSQHLWEDMDNGTLADVLTEWLFDGHETTEGIIATLYTAAWAFAELRARLKAYEDTGLAPEQVAALKEEKPIEAFLHPIDAYEGLKEKYLVFKADTGEKVRNCFVLRPDKDPAAIVALRAYAETTDNENLAGDIYIWVGKGEKAQRWIPVTERLPEEWTDVLVWSKCGFCVVAVSLGSHGKWREAWTHMMIDDNTITHWMPLPEAPKEGQQ